MDEDRDRAYSGNHDPPSYQGLMNARGWSPPSPWSSWGGPPADRTSPFKGKTHPPLPGGRQWSVSLMPVRMHRHKRSRATRGKSSGEERQVRCGGVVQCGGRPARSRRCLAPRAEAVRRAPYEAIQQVAREPRADEAGTREDGSRLLLAHHHVARHHHPVDLDHRGREGEGHQRQAEHEPDEAAPEKPDDGAVPRVREREPAREPATDREGNGGEDDANHDRRNEVEAEPKDRRGRARSL